MQIGLREVFEAAVAIFMLGGIWRDIRSTQSTVKSLKVMLAEDHQAVVALATAHNINHPGAKVPIPKAHTNGNGG